MKTEKKILIAFILNLSFSIFEIIGGMLTGSVAIISDALHDFGDAVCIAISYFLEVKSKKQPDEKYTFGYARYSVLGSVVTTSVLLLGSIMIIYNGVHRMYNPVKIDYNGMIFFAVVGMLVNFGAAYFTQEGNSLNQRAVNLHMLEDVLGWTVVLTGAVVMRFTSFALLDPLMSIGVAVFILVNAIKNLRLVLALFLEKIPAGIQIKEIEEYVRKIDGVLDVHDIHIWSMDGQNNFATMHIVTDFESREIKGRIREELREHGIGHATFEIEARDEPCLEKYCHTVLASASAEEKEGLLF